MKFNDIKSAVVKSLKDNSIPINECEIKKARHEVGQMQDGTPNYELYVEIKYKGKTVSIFGWMTKGEAMSVKIKSLSV